MLDLSSIEVELNPNIFPEEDIEWMEVMPSAALVALFRKTQRTGVERDSAFVQENTLSDTVLVLACGMVVMTNLFPTISSMRTTSKDKLFCLF